MSAQPSARIWEKCWCWSLPRLQHYFCLVAFVLVAIDRYARCLRCLKLNAIAGCILSLNCTRAVAPFSKMRDSFVDGLPTSSNTTFKSQVRSDPSHVFSAFLRVELPRRGVQGVKDRKFASWLSLKANSFCVGLCGLQPTR